MICKDILVEDDKAFCLGSDNIIYTCKECDEKTKECKNCVAIPKPKKATAHLKTYKGYDVEEYGFDMNRIMGMVKKKEFLFGLGAGLILGMLLFQR